jgi:hypothetical protein
LKAGTKKKKKKKTIFILHWVRYLRDNQALEYHIKNCIRDQYEQSYDIWSHPDWTRFVLEAYGHSFWVTVDPFLPSPLPPWAIALVFLEKPGRFARLSLGHEYYQYLRGHNDIRLRAAGDYLVHRRLIEIFPRSSPTGREQRALVREIARWLIYFARSFPPEFQPEGLLRLRSILSGL